MPKISIIMPNYNKEEFIKEAIKSVLNQTYSDWELIIIDDGSSDGSKEIINQYKKNSKIKTIFFPFNKGVTYAINKGMSVSKGEYLIILNSDDLWEPKILEEEINFLEKNKNFKMVFSDAKIIDSKGKTKAYSYIQDYCKINSKKILREPFLKILLSSNFIPSFTALIERKVYKDIGDHDSSLSLVHDWDYWLRVAQRFNIGFINKPLGYFRLGNKSLSRNPKQYKLMLKTNIKLFKKHLTFIPSYKKEIMKMLAISHYFYAKELLKDKKFISSFKNYFICLFHFLKSLNRENIIFYLEKFLHYDNHQWCL